MEKPKLNYIPIAKSLIYIVGFLLSLYAWYTRYYLWIDCFNELGRCYNPDGSNQVYTDSGIIWIFPATVFLLLTIKNIRKALKHNR